MFVPQRRQSCIGYPVFVLCAKVPHHVWSTRECRHQLLKYLANFVSSSGRRGTKVSWPAALWTRFPKRSSYISSSSSLQAQRIYVLIFPFFWALTANGSIFMSCDPLHNDLETFTLVCPSHQGHWLLVVVVVVWPETFVAWITNLYSLIYFLLVVGS